jgi:hypothetical protein
MNVHTEQSQAIITLLLVDMTFAGIMGLMIASIFLIIKNKLARQFNRPNKIKTKNGFLYRAHDSTYLPKELLEEHNSLIMLSNKKRHIAFLKRRLNYLEKSMKQSNFQ